MNIAILGSSGMLGGTLSKYFLSTNNKVLNINRSNINLSNININDLYDKINNYSIKDNINVIINAVGIIKQRSDTSSHEIIEINAVLPHKLSKICEDLNIKLIHITTDCVYNGITGKYTETDKHNATDLYGRSKSLGEPENCTVIRTSIIGEETKNKLSLVEWVKANTGGNINGFTNHLWNGMTCLQLSKVIHQIISENQFWLGVRHLYSDTINKYQLVSYINDIYDLNIKINPMNDVNSIDRSLSSNYSIENWNIPKIHQQILDMRNFHDYK